MDSNTLSYQIRDLEWQLDEAINARTELEEKQEALLEFASKCQQKAESFSASISRRKTRLGKLGGLLNSIRSAAAYNDKMQTMLSGTPYQEAKNSIEELLQSIGRTQQEVEQELESNDIKIRQLKYRLNELREDYRNCLEEERNGQE